VAHALQAWRRSAVEEDWVMDALANSGALWVLIFFALAIVYLLPTLVGMVRRVDRLALVIAVNLIGGTTGIGWLAAMILAFGPRRPQTVPLSSYRAH
jgi:hypothetical protein